MRTSCLLITVAAFAATGCTTHMRTYPEKGESSSVEGAAYRVPVLRYDISFEDTIVSCPMSFNFDGKEYWLGDVGLARKATAVSSYAAGERFAIDHAALTSVMKTSKYGFGSYESGVLKSFNTGAEDQTAPALKSVASVALSLYGLANPIKAATGVAGVPPFMGAFNAEGMKGLEQVAYMLGQQSQQESTSSRAPIEKLLKKATPGPAVACKPAIASAIKTSNDTDKFEAASIKLRDTTAELDALKLAVVSRAAANDDVKRLVEVMLRQSRETQAAEELKEPLDKAKSAITIKSEDRWIPGPDNWTRISPPNLSAKMENRPGHFIGRNNVLAWWKELSDVEQGSVAADPKLAALVENFGLEVGKRPSCDNCSDPVTLEAFSKSMASHFALEGPDLPVNVTSSSLVSLRHGRIDGLVVREPVPLRLATCIKPKPDQTCNAATANSMSADILVPQAGAFRRLPFKNGPFEAATLTATFQESGRMESFAYERTKAASSGADAIAEAMTKVEAFKKDREKQEKDKLTEARAEELAGITHQITMLTKQKELVALQSSPTPSEQQLMEAETARINAEIALFNAKRSRIEAEALLLAAAAGGQ